MKRRILSLLIAAALLCTLLPQLGLNAKAATTSGTCGTDLTWSFDKNTGTLVITGSGRMTDWNRYVEVPWYDHLSSIQNVSLPQGLTHIGDCAFFWCNYLKSISIPSSVTSIGEWAFSNCDRMTGVYISDPAAWSRITFGDWYSNPLQYAHNLYLNDALVTDFSIPHGVTSIGKWQFAGCNSLTSVTIPDGVTEISEYAFSNCENLDSVTIPSSVTEICEGAFNRCSITAVYITDLNAWCRIAFADIHSAPCGNLYLNGNLLTEVTIPDDMTTIGNYTFCGCGLTSVTIPDNVIRIGDYAFSSCNLTSLTIPKSVIIIGDYAFEDNEMTDLVIPEGVMKIGEGAFIYCTSLKSVSLPQSLTGVLDNTFTGCDSLTRITVPDGITSIDWYAFAECSSLTSITIPDSVESIGFWVFWGCSSLAEIIIPDSVTSIGDSAFSLCDSLRSVVIPKSVTSIGDGAFSVCKNLKSITVLNPQCDIHETYGGTLNSPKETTILGYRGSTAEAYAKQYNYSFFVLDGITAHSYVPVVLPATCTEGGYTAYICSYCGSYYVADEVPALGHSFGEATVVSPATCTTRGMSKRVCGVCGYEQIDFTDALGHEWNAGTVTSEPGMDISGERLFICLRCGETKAEIIPALNHEHSYAPVVTAPGCTEPGYTTYLCSCGDSYISDEVPALGHTYAEGVCTRCGEKDPNNVDYTKLTKAIESAEKVDRAIYTTASVSSLNQALNAAKSALKANSQKAVDSAYRELLYATELLVEKLKPEAYIDLRKAIAAAKNVYTRKYTDSSVAYMKKALEDAREALKIESVYEMEEVQNAAYALNQAIRDLHEKTFDEVVEEYHTLDLSKYTDESVFSFQWDVMEVQIAISLATSLFDLEEARDDLLEAMDALVEKRTFFFDDVRTSKQYFIKPVYWAYDHDPQITTGTDTTHFSPDAICTRAQVVTFLWRANGCPEPENTVNPFSDVKTDAYYYKAVLWAVENGITTGTTDTTFSPDSACTRAQVVTFQWRANGHPESWSERNPFTDVKADAYYYDAVLWAMENAITKGTSADRFSPDSTCTRGQIVTFLYRDLA